VAKRVLHDRYFRQAKREGYAARSAYKLLEINERRGVIAGGDAVLDLGCAPGSWLQVAAELVGDAGVVVGLDLHRVDVPIPANARTFEGDLREIDPEILLAPIREQRPEDERPPRPDRVFDAVVSDMAPATTGHGDDLRSTHLCRDVLSLCPALLKPRGNLVMKVLEGAEYPDLLKECRAYFNRVGAIKPRASRDISRETYVVAQGFWPAGKPSGGKPRGDHGRGGRA